MDAEGELLLGKARYMSPEQARMGRTDARSDLFSLGVVLHELVLGQPLFGADSTTTILEAVERKEIPRLRAVDPGVPDSLDAIVARCLERDPARRYGSAGELAVALEHYLYDGGLGPTVVDLQRHLAELFPERFGSR
jgi:serine/threonine-protein kinase